MIELIRINAYKNTVHFIHNLQINCLSVPGVVWAPSGLRWYDPCQTLIKYIEVSFIIVSCLLWKYSRKIDLNSLADCCLSSGVLLSFWDTKNHKNINIYALWLHMDTYVYIAIFSEEIILDHSMSSSFVYHKLLSTKSTNSVHWVHHNLWLINNYQKLFLVQAQSMREERFLLRHLSLTEQIARMISAYHTKTQSQGTGLTEIVMKDWFKI